MKFEKPGRRKVSFANWLTLEKVERLCNRLGHYVTLEPRTWTAEPLLAPELITSTGAAMSLEQLKACHVWGLGMIIFPQLNPDLEFPYQYELDQVLQKNFASVRNELVSRFKQHMLPT